MKCGTVIVGERTQDGAIQRNMHHSTESPSPKSIVARIDLTWLFWTKLCEKLSLERSFGYAEEEV
jgi:hypothetical protein